MMTMDKAITKTHHINFYNELGVELRRVYDVEPADKRYITLLVVDGGNEVKVQLSGRDLDRLADFLQEGI
jgi:hypothetical protein